MSQTWENSQARHKVPASTKCVPSNEHCHTSKDATATVQKAVQEAIWRNR